jgi:hypothetical protein
VSRAILPNLLEKKEVEMKTSLLGVNSGVMTLFAIGALAVSLPQLALAATVTPPPLPSPDLQVPAGNVAFLEGHGVGTQNYICLPSGAGFAFQLFTPEATLFSDDDKQLTTHFFAPNPNPPDNGAIRVTWQHSRDSSTVWAKLFHDPVNVSKDAIPWLVLQMTGVQDGPTGGDTLSATTFVQRLNTHGGLAPSTGCSSLADVGVKAFVPYAADYFFYRSDGQ